MRDSQALLPERIKTVFVPDEMLAPDQALVAYFSRAVLEPPGREHVHLDGALARILAEDARASADLPSHDRSTMDGFAVRSGDGAAPRTLAGEIRMGEPPPKDAGPLEALRIPTGGVLPHGADAVVPLEDAVEGDGKIVVRGAVRPGDFVTPAGSDLRAGDVALPAGRRIGAPELGVLATLGITAVPVFRQPVFGVLSTGDELVDAAAHAGVGQVRDSNRYAVGASLRAMGAIVKHYPRVVDERESLRDALAGVLEECDGVVLTGGSSVGARDLVPRVTAELGEPGVIVHGIRLKPGKPTMLAAVGGSPVIGLPGNPTSALMVLEAVARPIVAACTGERAIRPETVDAVAEEPFVGRDGWTWYVPAFVRCVAGSALARPLPLHSAHVSLLARASGYAVVGEWPSRIEKGERVLIRRFSCGGAPVIEAES